MTLQVATVEGQRLWPESFNGASPWEWWGIPRGQESGSRGPQPIPVHWVLVVSEALGESDHLPRHAVLLLHSHPDLGWAPQFSVTQPSLSIVIL